MIKLGDIYSKNGLQYIVKAKFKGKSIALHRLQFDQFSNYDFVISEDELSEDYRLELNPHRFYRDYTNHMERSFEAIRFVDRKVEEA